MVYSFTDIHIVGNNPLSSLTVIDGIIQTPKIKPKLTFSFQNEYYLYPAFINSSDILTHTLFNKITSENYGESSYLTNIIKHPYHKYILSLFSQEELLQLNHIKNILSGTLGVHYPYEKLDDDILSSGFLDILNPPKDRSLILTPSFSGDIDLKMKEDIYSLATFGNRNLLQEISQDTDMEYFFNSVTKNPAENFNLQMGQLKNIYPAHFFITKKFDTNPLENLKKIQLADIVLVIYHGKPIYGDTSFIDIAKSLESSNFYKLHVDNQEKFLTLRGSQKVLKKLETTVGYIPQIPIKL